MSKRSGGKQRIAKVTSSGGNNGKGRIGKVSGKLINLNKFSGIISGEEYRNIVDSVFSDNSLNSVDIPAGRFSKYSEKLSTYDLASKLSGTPKMRGGITDEQLVTVLREDVKVGTNLFAQRYGNYSHTESIITRIAKSGNDEFKILRTVEYPGGRQKIIISENKVSAKDVLKLSKPKYFKT